LRSIDDITHSIGSRLILLVATMGTVLLNTHYLGSEGMGRVALLQFGLLLVTGMAGFVAAGAVVYVRRSHRPKDLRGVAYLWCVFSSIVAASMGVKLGVFPEEWLYAAGGLGLLQSIVVFHSQLLIASGRIKLNNYLQIIQTSTLLLAVIVAYLVIDLGKPEGFAWALLGALAVTLLYSTIALWGTWNASPTVKYIGGDARKLLFVHGTQAQTGSILQLFTNRANLSLLFQAVGNAGAGVYSVVYYGVEAVWSIARAIAPMVNNEVAKASGSADRMAITSGYLKKTILLTLPLVVLACLIPESVYAWVFGIKGVAAPLRLLAPGMIAGAISSILAHHLSGVGMHKWNAITSGLGLSVLLTVGVYVLPISCVEDAAIAASCAYVAQATGLFFVWRLEQI
jgi:hypothetical protein